MGKIKTVADLSNQDGEDAIKFISYVLSDAIDCINGNISFTENCATQLLNITFTAANVNLSTQHKLGRTPAGYMVVGRSADTSVYDGDQISNNQFLHLRATVPATIKVLIF